MSYTKSPRLHVYKKCIKIKVSIVGFGFKYPKNLKLSKNHLYKCFYYFITKHWFYTYLNIKGGFIILRFEQFFDEYIGVTICDFFIYGYRVNKYAQQINNLKLLKNSLKIEKKKQKKVSVHESNYLLYVFWL